MTTHPQPVQDEKSPPIGGALDPAILRVIEALARPKPPPARLMTEVETAEYLGKIPITEVRRLTVGRVPIGRSWRWDRLALDAHLDALSGLRLHSPAASAEPADDIEAALDRSFGP